MSFLETIVILVVAVVVLGPNRLPAAARKIGRWMGIVRRASDEFKRQLMTMDQQVEREVTRNLDLEPDLVAEPMREVKQAVQNLDELPPAASPDDLWGTTPVAGGLAAEPDVKEATHGEA